LEALGAIEKEEPKPQELLKPLATASNEPGVIMKMGNMNLMMAQSQPMMQSQPMESLEDDDSDDIPFSQAPVQQLQSQPQYQQQQQQSQQQSVNVQTSSQPVLVVPLSMQQAAPTEMIPPAAPGAPATIAVDTSENAMRGIAPRPTSPRRATNTNTNANSNPNTTVTVNKVGSSQAPPPAANVRVNVNKVG
jgi:hypothetical protein